jgi:multidrug efflux system membrane fusion protein
MIHWRPFPSIVAALLLVASGCGGESARRTSRVPIAVAAVAQRSVPYEIDATGSVEAARSAAVTAQVGGLVTRIRFREGDEVRAGQVLVELDRRPFEAAAERAAAVLARDRAQAQTARLERDRAEALFAQLVVSVQERDQKRAAAEAAEATVRADSAALATAKLDLANATVRAPIDGRTGDLRVNVGDLVRANEAGTPLVTINQVRPVLVRFTVPQSDLPELQRRGARGMVVEAAPAERDSSWSTGTLVFVDNAVDPASGTVLLKGEFANRDRALWPGAFVRVRLRLFEQPDATVVPTAAVSTAQSGAYCYVVKADTTVEVRSVTVERAWRDLSVIASGLAPGEQVVVDGQLRLSPGARAFIRPGAGAGAPAKGETAAESASHGGAR